MKRLQHLLMASLLSFITGLLIISLVVNPVIVSAQSNQAFVPYSQPELEQLLAPIALYPDELLSHVLAASVYPQEVVAAEQFVQTRFASHNAMAQAVVSEPWDDSVKFLVQFRDVLSMMNNNLDWTQRLGDAFYNQQGDVMNTIQVLRQRAINNRTLASNQQILVENSGGVIIIKTRTSNRIYVPYYNPDVIYGSWDQPDYPPVVFAPPVDYRQDYYAPVIGFSVAIIIINSLFFPIYPDWHDHYLRRGDWQGHNNWQANTPWQFNSQRRAAAVTFNATESQLQTQRAPMLNNNINRNGQRGTVNNPAPVPGHRAPLVQPNRAPLQPTNRAGLIQPNRAPLVQPNRTPLQPTNRAPLMQQNRAPTIQPNTGFSHGGGQIRPPENRAPVMQPRVQPNAGFSRETAPARPPANVIREQNRAPIEQPRAQPNARFSHEAAPARPPANVIREQNRAPIEQPRVQPNAGFSHAPPAPAPVRPPANVIHQEIHAPPAPPPARQPNVGPPHASAPTAPPRPAGPPKDRLHLPEH